MAFEFGPRRAKFIDMSKESFDALTKDEIGHLEKFDLIYRSLCALMYNYVPTSGHPGGSISSGRFVANLIFNSMDYDLSDPDRNDADIISYAAGHKALGLYSMWALRNEIAKISAPEFLPKDERYQLRLEDLLGFRRNPVTDTPLFKKFHSKPLDGHPTPATPFVKLSTGASGVGIATSLGLAFGAKDYYGDNSPLVHIVEGEGGMTPGRVAESFASAGTSSLSNTFIHVDWNQASIDSNRVCREGTEPGDYVQWTPAEFAYLHDWNVVMVSDGKDFAEVAAAQKKALQIKNGQPTAIIYKTIKGWQYGIEGRASHGAGHKLCADGFYEALKPLLGDAKSKLPACPSDAQRCKNDDSVREQCLYDAILVVRQALENNPDMCAYLSTRLSESRNRLNNLQRKPRSAAPNVDSIYETAAKECSIIPPELALETGTFTTLRGELGRALSYLNAKSGGAIFAAAADLLGSTSVNAAAKGFADGFYNSKTNPGARILSIGGICEDAICGVLAGLSTYGRHLGAGSSYGAFIAPLGHIAARLHCIGSQSRQEIKKEPYRPFILICAHAGLKTGEDGPTHADPQALQLLQENFPVGTFISLTPWDPQEIWPLFATALAKRPAVIAPFVTRPDEKVFDRKAMGLAPASDAAKGFYLLCKTGEKPTGTIVLQESGITNDFMNITLPLLKKEEIHLNVYYCASAELFDMLPKSEQDKIFPEAHAMEAMGITGFTLPTMHKWIRSNYGRAMTLHPFMNGHYLGSGQAKYVLKQAGLDGESQFRAIKRYLKEK